jgi:uncharacterized protein
MSDFRGEWPATLDVAALLAGGWRPVPFREFIVKIHSRCDLACDYCYMYEMADQSWRDRPRRMSVEIAEQTAVRIGEHARAHALSEIVLILHGGEPLLAGHELIWRLVTATRKEVGPGVGVAVHLQTNGVGLTQSYLRLFAELGIRVGVSLDGDTEAQDRHRRFPSGRGSHAAVAAGLARLGEDEFRHLFSGLLCTVDLRSDPIETYEALVSYGPPHVDFLLPHGTWDTPPPGRSPDSADTPYADWLTCVFDRWYREPVTDVRLFSDIMRLLLGGTSAGEAVGLAPARMAVVETDGWIEQVDNLKAAYHGAALTGLHVAKDPFDAASYLPGMVARQLGVRGLSAECRSCPIHRVCGGGVYAHRYRSGSGFANRSVYCPDLIGLITHISNTIREDVAMRLRRKRP